MRKLSKKFVEIWRKLSWINVAKIKKKFFRELYSWNFGTTLEKILYSYMKHNIKLRQEITDNSFFDKSNLSVKIKFKNTSESGKKIFK